jgi:Domain of unknown function (DUF4251)
MKKLFTIFFSLLVMSSCSTTKEANSSRAEARKEKKLLNQELVKSAIESKRYIIKFDKMYVNFGFRELFPRANFLIVDKEKAILSTAYLGRQYDIKPIAAINIRGRSVDYAVTDNISKGSYDIKMKVNNNGSNTFDVFIKVSKDGSCYISVSSLKIENVNYSGYLVPIPDTTNPATQPGNLI